MQTKHFVALISAGIILLIAFVVAMSSFTVINAGERGVIVRLGDVQEDRVLDEGFHLKVPFIESVVHMDVTTQKIETEADAASKDLQSVDATVALNYSLDPNQVAYVFQDLRREYQARLIDPAIQEAVKAATAQFTAEELITKRPEVRDAIRLSLSERLTPEGIEIKNLSIVNFNFSTAFDAAIEAKQVAEQDALRAERELQRIKIEAEQRVAEAQAEAEAIRIQAEAVTSQGGEDYVALQWIEAWDGKMPTYMMGDATPLVNIK